VLLDGGLIANAPDMIALGILQRRLGAKLTDCHILSIGTCAPIIQAQPPRPIASGKAGWILRRRNIVDVTLDSQEKLTVQIMKHLLKEQFFRIDSQASDMEAELISGLDVVTPETTQLLKKLADERFQALAGSTSGLPVQVAPAVRLLSEQRVFPTIFVETDH
jgi:hypothetical protein